MPSPSFSIDGGSPLTKAAVSASATVTCVLDSLDSVRQVEWSIAGTDETSTPGDYTLLTSGTLGSTMTTTALTAGKAARVRCIINGGNAVSGDPDPEGTMAEAKFYVAPEVLCADEFNDADRISSLTHGATATINPALRASLGSTPSFTTVEAGAFLSTGTEATAGLLRGTNNSVLVAARNAANSANIDVATTDASDNIVIGEDTDATSVRLKSKAGGFLGVYVAGTEVAQLGNSFLRIGASAAAVAQSGGVRVISNTVAMASRNAADSADINLIATDGSDNVTVGDATDAASVRLDAKTGGSVVARINSTDKLTVSGTDVVSTVTITVPSSATGLKTSSGFLQIVSANKVYYDAAGGQDHEFRVAEVSKFDVQANGAIFGGNTASFGSGNGVVQVNNATTAPTTNPSGAGLLYADGGAGKWRGSSGTVTTFGPAEPHCPVCDSDFVTEHDSDTYGYLSVCLRCLADELGERAWIRRSRA